MNDESEYTIYVSPAVSRANDGLWGDLGTRKVKMADECNARPIFVVDAFTDKAFGGNPAAVCLVGSNVS